MTRLLLPRRRFTALPLAALVLAAAARARASTVTGPAAPAPGAAPGAAPGTAPGTVTAGATPPAVAAALAPIHALDTALLAIMHAGKAAPFQRRFDRLAPAVDRAFDLPHILRFSIGSGWSDLDATMQASLLTAFRRYTVASYVDNFDSFDGQTLTEQPTTRALPGGEQVVFTRIVSRSGASHALDYVMRQDGGQWKAIDVLADGAISRVAVQRSDFRHLLDHGGAEALMASLQRKVRNLSRG